jgi:uncharacterized protein (DUF2236 family)
LGGGHVTPLPPPVFSPESAIWRITSERVILLGGPAAAVLQAAHPEVAVGVAGHSSFVKDPFGRLARTLRAVYTAVYGLPEEKTAMAERIARIHRSVKGSAPIPYSAFSLDAQMWVLATLVLMALASHDRFFRPVTESFQAAYLQDMRQFGTLFGLPVEYGPQTWAEFQSYTAEMLAGDFLGSREECRLVARSIVAPPGPFWRRVLLYPTRSLVLEFLPTALSQRLGLPRSLECGALVRLAACLLPALIPRLPKRIRRPLDYRLAEERNS